MNPLHWHPEPPPEGWLKNGISIGVGILLGIVILIRILKPFTSDSQRPELSERRIILPADVARDPGLNLDQATELLIDAIIQIESHGHPEMVGGLGERGLMQIRESTWKEVTRKHFGETLSFDRAFDPDLNRQVGRYYLGDLQVYLYKNRGRWRSDLRSLLLACYNAGPERVRKSGFNLENLPKTVQSYASRGSALHDWYLEGDAEPLHKVLQDAAPVEEKPEHSTKIQPF